jgi:hypothetical protein
MQNNAKSHSSALKLPNYFFMFSIPLLLEYKSRPQSLLAAVPSLSCGKEGKPNALDP